MPSLLRLLDESNAEDAASSKVRTFLQSVSLGPTANWREYFTTDAALSRQQVCDNVVRRFSEALHAAGVTGCETLEALTPSKLELCRNLLSDDLLEGPLTPKDTVVFVTTRSATALGLGFVLRKMRSETMIQRIFNPCPLLDALAKRRQPGVSDL